MSEPRFYRLAKEWQTFRGHTLRDDLTSVRQHDLRWAFYGGAIAMFDLLRLHGSPETIEDLGREMHEFAESVKQELKAVKAGG